MALMPMLGGLDAIVERRAREKNRVDFQDWAVLGRNSKSVKVIQVFELHLEAQEAKRAIELVSGQVPDRELQEGMGIVGLCLQ